MFGEGFANKVADTFGSWPSVFLHLAFIGAWVLTNSLVFGFDTFPFVFLTLILSIEAIMLSLILLIGQNKAQRESERREKRDLAVDTEAHRMIKELYTRVMEGK